MPEPIQSTPVLPPPVHTEPEISPAPLPPAHPQAPIYQLGLVDASTSLSQLARDCAPELDGAVIAVAGVARNPLIAALASLKAGAELNQCVEASLHQDDVDATIIECTKRGGTPVGVLEFSVSCQGMKP
jgi:hypothetical protein